MKQTIITLSGSLALSTLLLVGCGSSGATSDKAPSQAKSIKEKFAPPAHVVEFDKQKEIRSYLEEKGISLKSSSYSQDKASIYIIGVDKEKYTFYKFDAQTLNLLETTPISVIGTIDMGTSEDGKVAIKATEDGTQSNYLFDVSDKKLVLKSEKPVKTPQQIIQEEVGGDFSVTEFIRTPSTMGGLVMIDGKDGSRTLWLYGMENPKVPAREYAIFTGNTKNEISNITLLGNGIISYEHINNNDHNPNKKQVVTYDYFNKKEVKKTDEGIESASVDTLKRLIQQKLPSTDTIVDLQITPTKLGAFAVINTNENAKYLALYGLEDLNNPKQERRIINRKQGVIKDIVINEIKSGGIIAYTLDIAGDKVKVTYNYYKKEFISFDTNLTGTKKATALIKAIRYSKSVWGVSTPSFLEHLEADKYIMTYNYSYMDGYQKTSILDTSTAKETVLTSIHYGPGGHEAENISVDKNAKTIQYETRFDYYDVPEGSLEKEFDMTKNIKYTYNYATKEKTKVFPVVAGVSLSTEDKVKKDVIEVGGVHRTWLRQYKEDGKQRAIVLVEDYKEYNDTQTYIRVYDIHNPDNLSLTKEFEVLPFWNTVESMQLKPNHIVEVSFRKQTHGMYQKPLQVWSFDYETGQKIQ